jgi:Major Facilitator Superfamily
MHPPRARHLIDDLVPDRGPKRVFTAATLVTSFGFGLILAASALYFTRVVHLSTGQVGAGLSIAGLVGLIAGVPVGDLADRYGPREVMLSAMAVQAVTTFSYIFIRNFVGFFIVVTLDMLAMTASMAADGALNRRVGGEDATKFRASLRAVANLGISFGSIGCGIAVQIDTPDSYRALIIANALMSLCGAVVVSRLPHYEPLPKDESGPRWGALTDRPFIAYTVVSGAMSIQYGVLMFLLPLWLVLHTHAPRWSIALFTLINTVLCVLFQVRVGRDVHTTHQGGAAMRRSGVIFLVSCAAFGFAAGLPGWAALLLLAAATAVHTYGELWFAASTFALDISLAPANAQGQYQGLVGIGFGAGQAAAPVVLIGLCLSLGRAGWIGLGVAFALLGLLAPLVTGWAERTRADIPGFSTSLEATTGTG